MEIMGADRPDRTCTNLEATAFWGDSHVPNQKNRLRGRVIFLHIFFHANLSCEMIRLQEVSDSKKLQTPTNLPAKSTIHVGIYIYIPGTRLSSILVV